MGSLKRSKENKESLNEVANYCTLGITVLFLWENSKVVMVKKVEMPVITIVIGISGYIIT